MSRRIFLDVGAHKGQTLAAVMQRPEFDRIVCFEPVAQCVRELEAMSENDERVLIEPFGLWDHDAQAPVFQPGSKGAGMWKKDKATCNITHVCAFMRASRWMRKNIREGEIVFLKLNCEGAECDILDDLLDSGEFGLMTYVMVDFDVRKISAMKYREQQLRERLEQYEFPRVGYSKQVMLGPTHAERIHHWIDQVNAHA